MPRRPDPDLEKRVLDAAQKLWRGGGDESFSMRALARMAKTNTPAIYRRFKTREDILRALLLRLRQDLYHALESAQSLEEASERYIDFALSRPREYELYHTHQHELLRTGRARAQEEMGPTFQWTLRKLADHLGGSPQDHVRLVLAMWAIAHGTATLLIDKAVPANLEAELRSACTRAISALVCEACPRP